MSLTELQQTMMAYYVAGPAKDLVIAGRFFPHGELVLIYEDKIVVATRKFGTKVANQSRTVATAFLDMLIEKGIYSTKRNDFGGSMHQFQNEPFRALIAELNETDPIIQQAKAQGSDFWAARFAELLPPPAQ